LLQVGLFEPAAAAWNVPRVPDGFSFGEIEPDWARMGPFVEKAMARVPATLSAGVKKFFCGPESFTPDLAPVVGEAPELKVRVCARVCVPRVTYPPACTTSLPPVATHPPTPPAPKNYFVAAGMNSIGILTGGGIGRLLAHWIAHGQPDMDVTGINIDRLQVRPRPLLSAQSRAPVPRRPPALPHTHTRTSAVRSRTNPRPPSAPRASWRAWATCTRCTSRTRPARARAAPSGRPFTTVWRRAGRTSAT
jgi:hypothetical protein